MNYLTALKMKEKSIGIFRSLKANDYVAPDAPKHLQKFLTIWNSSGGKYCKFENLHGHDMLKLEAYLHITSPNRRLVDLLNIIIFQESFGSTKSFGSQKSLEFYNKWYESIDYINKTNKLIKRVQNDCNLLHACTQLQDPLHEVSGYILNKTEYKDKFQYTVYIPSLKMTNRLITSELLVNLESYNFKIYIFMDEIHLKQKIRLLLV
jgi:exoribonuclease R